MVSVNDIVQLNENHKWCGALVQVTEVMQFGIQGFIKIPERGNAYVRVKNEDFEIVGKSVILNNIR